MTNQDSKVRALGLGVLILCMLGSSVLATPPGRTKDIPKREKQKG
jgi:hypothetical protein